MGNIFRHDNAFQIFSCFLQLRELSFFQSRCKIDLAKNISYHSYPKWKHLRHWCCRLSFQLKKLEDIYLPWHGAILEQKLSRQPFWTHSQFHLEDILLQIFWNKKEIARFHTIILLSDGWNPLEELQRVRQWMQQKIPFHQQCTLFRANNEYHILFLAF